jgi:hypothetical protein
MWLPRGLILHPSKNSNRLVRGADLKHKIGNGTKHLDVLDFHFERVRDYFGG